MQHVYLEQNQKGHVRNHRRSMFFNAMTLLAFLLLYGNARAQLTGTINVPSSGYADLASVVTALNAQGVGTGGVTINVLASNPQAAPAGGYLLGSATLNASVSSSKTITINGNGNTITAFTPGAGSVDGVFKIQGVDYLTIDGLNIAENSANTTATTMMEWGYALVKLSSVAPFDGCQNVTIKNCSIALTITNTTAVAAGIYSGNHIASATTALTLTAATDAASNNTFTNNTISGVRKGISLNGFADPAFVLYDKNNTVGGATAALGNKIQDFATTTTTAGTSYGIYLSAQSNINVQNNTINNAVVSPTPSNGTLYGIYYDNASKALNNIVFACSNNTIQLSTSSTSGALYGINSGINGANSTVNINNNTLQRFAMTGNTNAGNLRFIYQDVPYNYVMPGTVQINGNKIINNINLARTGNAQTYFIFSGAFSGGAAGVSNITVTNNVIDSFTRNSGTSTSTLGNYLYGIYIGIDQSAGIVTGTATITGNKFTHIIDLGGSGGGTEVHGILTYTGNRHKYLIDNNIISVVSSVRSQFTGVDIWGGDTVVISNNKVDSISNGGTDNLYALKFGNNGTFTFAPIRSVTYCYNNIISNLSSTATTGVPLFPYVIGIGLNGGENYIYNNIISGLTAPNPNMYSPIVGIDLGGVLGKTSRMRTNFVYYNTINIGGSAGISGYGATGIFYNGLDTNNIYNNIVYVNANPGSAAAATVAAIRETDLGNDLPLVANTPPSSILLKMDNNVYYVQPGIRNYFFVQGLTNSTVKNGYGVSGVTPNVANNIVNDPFFNTSCSLYKAYLGSNRESNSYYENNLTQVAPNQYAPTGISYAEGAATTATIPAIATDYAGVTRGAKPDIGALQFSGTVPTANTPPVITYTKLNPISYCVDAPTLVVTITSGNTVNTTPGTSPRLYYRKATDNNAFGTYPGDNNASFNGWKYVEANISGNTYTFIPDYSKLTATVTVGDSITYFVIAQDNAVVPNVSVNVAGFSVGCSLPGVDLGPSIGSTTVTPTSNGYKIYAIPSLPLIASSIQQKYCMGGSASLSLTNIPKGIFNVQWQLDNNTGIWTDIPGATGLTYTSPALANGNNFRAQIRCNGTPIMTSNAVNIVVNILPTVVVFSGSTRCGAGALTLQASGNGDNYIWYDALTGGHVVDTGKTLTLPSLSSNVTYYVTAITKNADTVRGGMMAPVNPTVNGYNVANVGLAFNALNSFVLHSVYVYPRGTGSGTVKLNLTDDTGKILMTKTVNLTGAATDVKTEVVLDFPIGKGTGYRLVQGGITGGITGLTGEIYNGTNLYPMTIPGVLSITGGTYTPPLSASTIGTYWCLYDWRVITSCESSPRIPATATVNSPTPISVSATPSTLCGPGNVTLKATSTNPSYVYSWTPGPLNGGTVNTTATATTMYRVIANDFANGCEVKDSVTVTVNPVPAASITPTGVNFCKGDSALLSANFGGGLTYKWKLNGVDIPGATDNDYYAKDSGDYTVEVSNGLCSAVAAPVRGTQYPLPTPVITKNTKGDTLMTGTYTTYQWNRVPQGPIPGAQNPTYGPTADGDYSVTVKDANGCEGTSVTFHFTMPPPESIAGVGRNGAVAKVWPNPATNMVYIEAPVSVNAAISSVDGKLVLYKENAKAIDISALANGIYMVRLTDENGTLVAIQKLIKTSW